VEQFASGSSSRGQSSFVLMIDSLMPFRALNYPLLTTYLLVLVVVVVVVALISLY